MPDPSSPLCLASASEMRARLLSAAGIDEAAVKAAYSVSKNKRSLAAVPAEQKAIQVAARHPRTRVLGADQTLTSNGTVFDKSNNLAAAQETSVSPQGKRHTLTAAERVARDSEVLWRYQAQAVFEMRPFSVRFLDAYLKQEGDTMLSSAGAYRLEDIGAQLFSAVEGDYFTMLGLPRIPVLVLLRREGVLVS